MTAFATRLRQLADADPNKPALIHDGETLTRAELDARSNALARTYAAMGVREGSLVSIVLPNSIEYLVAAWAIWKLGATPLPLSPRLAPAERSALIELADAALVVGEDPGGGRPWVPAGFTTDESADPLPIAISQSWKAPTSGGSTGRPKIIMAGEPANYDLVMPFAVLLSIDESSRMLITGPLHHNGPFLMASLGMLCGATVVLMTRFDAEQTLKLVEAHDITWLYAVPTMMHRISRLPGGVKTAYDLRSVKLVFHMAAPCPPWLKLEWIEWFGPDKIFELYAGTEAVAASVITGAEYLQRPGSVGRALLGEFKILDADGNEVPPGTIGEVWMRRDDGITPTYQYVGATSKRRDGHWESLGDMGHVDDDGYLYLADRDTDMILVGGSNVYPAEVEAALESHPDVLSSCVIGLPDDEMGSRVHAIVQLEREVGDDALQRHLEPLLSRYKIPRTFERSASPLRDDAGKVRRSALRAERVTTAPGQPERISSPPPPPGRG